ncbi:MAG: hypothetical protein R2745_23990 [Vicinamibacterales bacterium]
MVTLAVLGALVAPASRTTGVLDQAHVLADQPEATPNGVVDVAVEARAQAPQAPDAHVWLHAHRPQPILGVSPLPLSLPLRL